MKKIYELFNWLSQNDIKFIIKDLDDEEGNILITTNQYTFETFNYCHECLILTEAGVNIEFKISELNLMYKN